MKTQRYIWMTTLGLLLTAGAGAWSAENDQRPRQRQNQSGERPLRNRAERLETMARELNLTEGQKAQLREVWRKDAEKIRSIRQDENLTPEEKRTKAREAMRAMPDQLKKILTVEQFEKWQEMRGNRANRPAGGRARQDGRPRGPAQEGDN
jgi:hypothetical protein